MEAPVQTPISLIPAFRVAPAVPAPSPKVATQPLALVDAIDAPRTSIPTQLSAPPGFGLDYWKKLTELGERPPAYASKIEALTDRSEAWAQRLALIGAAQSTIVNTLYIIEPDAYGEAYLDALIAATKRGVKVTLVVDFLAQHAWYSTYPNEEVEGVDKKLDALIEAGGVVAWYAPPIEQVGRLGRGMHFKSLIVDGHTAIYGGRNVGESYVVKWGDFEVLLQGTIVGSLGAETIEIMRHADPTLAVSLFEHDQAKQDYQLRLDSALAEIKRAFMTARGENAARALKGEPRGTMMQLVVCDPLRTGSVFEPEANRVTTALLETFKRATKSITVTSNYVNASDALQGELIAASKRGVAVTVITAGPNANTKSNIPYINASTNYPALLDAGIRIMETRTLDHSKVYVVDDKVAAFGSYNLEKPADGSLVEGLMFTDDPKMVETAKAHLEHIIATNTDVYVRPRKLGFWESIADFFKRFFYGLLAHLV